MNTRLIGFIALAAAGVAAFSSGFAAAAGPAPLNSGQGTLCPPRNQAPVQGPASTARTVNVTVPLAIPPQGNALNFPQYCPRPRHAPAPAAPVRVEVAVRPELQGSTPVPVAFRDQGPVAPLLANGIGLVASAIAAPFRLINTVVSIADCRAASQVPCGPRPCPLPYAAAPGGPSVGPQPPAGCPAPGRNGPPPALVQEYQFPAVEPQSLLGGIANLPGRVIQNGRFTGDLFTSPQAGCR